MYLFIWSYFIVKWLNKCSHNAFVTTVLSVESVHWKAQYTKQSVCRQQNIGSVGWCQYSPTMQCTKYIKEHTRAGKGLNKSMFRTEQYK